MPTHLPWPRHGHTQVLVDEYKDRRSSLVGWARAGFFVVSMAAADLGGFRQSKYRREKKD